MFQVRWVSLANFQSDFHLFLSGTSKCSFHTVVCSSWNKTMRKLWAEVVKLLKTAAPMKTHWQSHFQSSGVALRGSVTRSVSTLHRAFCRLWPHCAFTPTKTKWGEKVGGYIGFRTRLRGFYMIVEDAFVLSSSRHAQQAGLRCPRVTHDEETLQRRDAVTHRNLHSHEPRHWKRRRQPASIPHTKTGRNSSLHWVNEMKVLLGVVSRCAADAAL